MSTNSTHADLVTCNFKFSSIFFLNIGHKNTVHKSYKISVYDHMLKGLWFSSWRHEKEHQTQVSARRNFDGSIATSKDLLLCELSESYIKWSSNLKITHHPIFMSFTVGNYKLQPRDAVGGLRDTKKSHENR